MDKISVNNIIHLTLQPHLPGAFRLRTKHLLTKHFCKVICYIDMPFFLTFCHFIFMKFFSLLAFLRNLYCFWVWCFVILPFLFWPSFVLSTCPMSLISLVMAKGEMMGSYSCKNEQFRHYTVHNYLSWGTRTWSLWTECEKVNAEGESTLCLTKSSSIFLMCNSMVHTYKFVVNRNLF